MADSKATSSVTVCGSSEEVNDKLQKIIEEALAGSRGRNEQRFSVGVSGGSVVQTLGIVLPRIKTDWSKWIIFFCDERMVRFKDKESTFGCYQRELLPKIKELNMDQFVNIDPCLMGEACAIDYSSKLKRMFPAEDKDSLPRFDLLILGMGPDGHTCSLFPEHSLLKETSQWVAFISDSPKPPPNRVTLTLPVINNSRCAVFVATGSSKAQALKEIMVDGKDLPAGSVKLRNGCLHWLLDTESAKLLPQSARNTSSSS